MDVMTITFSYKGAHPEFIKGLALLNVSGYDEKINSAHISIIAQRVRASPYTSDKGHSRKFSCLVNGDPITLTNSELDKSHCLSTLSDSYVKEFYPDRYQRFGVYINPLFESGESKFELLIVDWKNWAITKNN